MLVQALSESGYATDAAATGDEALEALQVEAYDAAVLDVMLPGISGIEVCRVVRADGSAVPILLLTALDATRHRVAGLDAGADDYLVKPFHLAELTARVRALLRRSPRTDPPQLQVGALRLDPATRVVAYAGDAVELTAKEFSVLEYLMRHPGRVVAVSELIDHAWDRNYDGGSNVVASTVRHLRGKLRTSGPDPIVTVRGVGYRVGAAT
ncbi:DNA-binding response regulator [Cellulomonas chitinilytica]|uniref:DNA-binding response regulator n=1 Tax=Cellulomonas chitinilytica TaxID=398759 RepID=A0A919TXZ6_9CELL|nr:DNA-binding response regulator [Cellulomonas chitinilytica]